MMSFMSFTLPFIRFRKGSDEEEEEEVDAVAGGTTEVLVLETPEVSMDETVAAEAEEEEEEEAEEEGGICCVVAFDSTSNACLSARVFSARVCHCFTRLLHSTPTSVLLCFLSLLTTLPNFVAFKTSTVTGKWLSCRSTNSITSTLLLSSWQSRSHTFKTDRPPAPTNC
jgi:hypothetical protein